MLAGSSSGIFFMTTAMANADALSFRFDVLDFENLVFYFQKTDEAQYVMSVCLGP